MTIKTFKEKIWFLLLKRLPIQNNTVLFKSFSGQYGDNPKYVSEKLHEIAPAVRQIWVTSPESNINDYPEYVSTVSYYSWLYHYHASTAQVVVDNMSGIRSFRQRERKSYRRPFLNRNDQLNICTWHGTPLKQIGAQEFSDVNVYQSSAKYMTAGNRYCRDIFERAFPGIPIQGYGTPRNDIFFQDVDISALRDKLDLPNNKKLLLYAPTFRNDVNSSGVDQLSAVKINDLLQVLSKRFGGEWALVIRLHHEVLKCLHESFTDFVDNENVFDGNAHDDIGDYLLVSDALWTDYSSSFFDYLLSEKPCFLMSLDRNRYLEEERGLYLQLNALPFPFADSPEELYGNILSYNEEQQRKANNEFLDFLGSYEDGKASERFVKEILDYMV